MACRTPSVERVADKTQEANNQINKLLEMLKRDEATTKAEFFTRSTHTSKRRTSATDVRFTSTRTSRSSTRASSASTRSPP